MGEEIEKIITTEEYRDKACPEIVCLVDKVNELVEYLNKLKREGL